MSTKSLRLFTKRIFVVTNICVALFFLFGCYGNWFAPLQFWFTGFFSLASFYLLLVLIGFIVFWIFTKPRFILISVVAILLAWAPLKHLLKLRLSSTFTMQKQPVNIRVMSWNVEHFDILEHKTHPERKQEMIDMINSYQPDVACFQEMVGSDSMPAAINYIPYFMKGMHMKDYHYSYNWKVDFDASHHFGIITFSKYPVINKQTVSFPPNDYNSIFQYIDIVKDQDTFRVFNIHLQSLKFSDNNLKYIDDPSLKDEADLKNSKNILSKFRIGFVKHRVQSDRVKKEMDKSPYPVIVCGDFNDVPNSYAYHTIGKGMKNAFAEKGTGIGRTFFSISPTLRIDNIFTDSRFSIAQYVRVKKKISDHFPIIADLYFKKD
ncbi:MAG: endonuclease/exonuclease/phosphatase family protein [Ferruginibacter sp.]